MKRGAYKPSISGTNAKLLSAGLGCVLLVIAIFLENNFPNDAKVAQIVVWTLIAVSVPVLLITLTSEDYGSGKAF